MYVLQSKEFGMIDSTELNDLYAYTARCKEAWSIWWVGSNGMKYWVDANDYN